MKTVKILALSLILVLMVLSTSLAPVHAMAADMALAPTGENYIGVRYKAALLEDQVSNTGWMLIFGGSGFTKGGEYEPHFIDLMIHSGGAGVYDDGLCAAGFPQYKQILSGFSVQFGLSDYQNHHDIAAWSHNPALFPRMFTNIDSTDPKAPDKIMAEYQATKAGSLEGREIEVSFVRAELTRLPRDKNFFTSPDNGCKPYSQADIVYRRWVATLAVPSLGISSSVDFYINADHGDYILGTNTLNFMWESPGPNPPSPNDKYKVIIYDPEVQTASGEWKKGTKFLVDYRTPRAELPLNDKGQLIGGYRKVSYKGQPAIEASFGYGYTDYVTDGDPTNYEPSDATKGAIDLSSANGIQARLDVTASPNPVTLKPGESGTVTYTFTEMNAARVHLTSRDWVWLFADGSLFDGGSGSNDVNVGPFSSATWVDHVYLLPDAVQRAQQLGYNGVVLATTFHGTDSNGNMFDVKASLLIEFSLSQTTTLNQTTIFGVPLAAYAGVAALVVLVALGIVIAMRRLPSRKERKPPIPTPTKAKFCISCRAELPIDAKFCDNCGASQK